MRSLAKLARLALSCFEEGGYVTTRNSSVDLKAQLEMTFLKTDSYITFPSRHGLEGRGKNQINK